MPVPVRFALIALGVLIFAATFFTRGSVDRALKRRSDPDGGVSLQKDALLFMGRIVGVFFLLIGLMSWVVARAPTP